MPSSALTALGSSALESQLLVQNVAAAVAGHARGLRALVRRDQATKTEEAAGWPARARLLGVEAAEKASQKAASCPCTSSLVAQKGAQKACDLSLGGFFDRWEVGTARDRGQARQGTCSRRDKHVKIEHGKHANNFDLPLPPRLSTIFRVGASWVFPSGPFALGHHSQAS